MAQPHDQSSVAPGEPGEELIRLDRAELMRLIHTARIRELELEYQELKPFFAGVNRDGAGK
jgi:hypothetical protein